MKPLNKSTYLLHEQEVSNHLTQRNPVLRVNLYGELLHDGPFKTVYFKLILSSKQRRMECDKILCATLRKYSGKTLAFSFELLNPHTNTVTSNN